ncbi:DNA polymerase Y family protein [Roseococcus sp. SYP-B2431]|uniref:DNA polymerase Y family protein n=1 Tax=Roseococcus sp. SYP-B2431 TaxID=2496640 RepID=UPI00103E439F|nr:DNA polymerase Y family protein [Roseococcus sp. SYP-B2431]TCH96939.1 DNA polymerase Y family protein [Roseococcus sp. SYP-B2431]
MGSRRFARTPNLPLFEGGLPCTAPPLLPAQAGTPLGERRFLMLHGEKLAAERPAVWALRFSPLVGIWRDEGLLIETTGLPDREPELLRRVRGAFAAAGAPARGLLGCAPAALAALLRAGARPQVLTPDQEAAALPRLPVTALALPEEMIPALHRLGLRDVAALEAQPRGPLARRFGPAIAEGLAALRGRIAPFTPVRPPPRHVQAQEYLSPLCTAPALERAIGTLADQLCTGLLESGEGARALRLLAFRGDGSWQELRQGLGQASRDPGHLRRLLDRRIEELRPELGFEKLILAAEVTEALHARQAGLPGEETPQEALSELLDRLAQRVRIWRLEPRESHWPERAVRRASAFEPVVEAAPAPRPLRLLRRPIPITVSALVPDHPPFQIMIGKRVERVVSAEGPERIEPEWWRPPEDRPARDYYCVQLASGARWWVCRRGAMGDEEKWFVHGFLP